MYKEEIEAQIEKLTRRLKEYEKERRYTITDQNNMERASEELSKKAREIEERINGVMETVDKKLSGLNPNSRFSSIYREGVRKRIMNSNTDDAIAETKAAAQRAKKECMELDEKIGEYDIKIAETQAEIEALRIKLSKAVL